MPKPEVVVWLVLRVLRSHYETEAKKLDNVLRSFEELQVEHLAQIWQSLLDDGMSYEDALSCFTQYVKLNIEEDGCIVPEDDGDAYHTFPLIH